MATPRIVVGLFETEIGSCRLSYEPIKTKTVGPPPILTVNVPLRGN